MEIKSVAKGFTLIELLVVILIIGLLTAIAIPGYRKAVEKSKVADALTTMQAVAKSEHGFYLAKNTYTKDFADLDIALIDKDGNKAEDDSFETINYTFTLQNNNIKARRSNGEYTLYKLYEDNNIFCLPTEHYICQQYDWGMNRNACENGLNGAWSNIKNNCYGSEQERCAANNEYGATWQTSNGGYCGVYYKNGVRIEEFQECRGWNGSCSYSTFTGEGAKCDGGWTGCHDSEFHQGAECNNTCNKSTFTTGSTCKAAEGCQSSYFTSGSKCYGTYNWRDCSGSTFEDGAECIGNKSGNGGCRLNTYKEGGKCIAYGSGSCSTDHLGGIHPEYFEPGSYCVGEGANACRNMKNFKATCVANAPGACSGNTYTGDGCCKGDYCPTNDQNVVICQD